MKRREASLLRYLPVTFIVTAAILFQTPQRLVLPIVGCNGVLFATNSIASAKLS